MKLEIKTIYAAQTFPVRHPELREGKPVESCSIEGDLLENTLHIGAYLGLELVGVASFMNMEKQDALFNDISNPTEVGRYHSWAMKDENVADLEVIARSKDGCIMAIRHKKYAVKGVQFHPESVLTPEGKRMIENWLNEK